MTQGEPLRDNESSPRGPPRPRGQIRRELEDLVGQGVLTATQADEVAARLAAVPTHRAPRPVLAEVGGYLGAALAAAAVLLLVGEVWGDLGRWVRTAVLAVVTGVLLGAGWWVRVSLRTGRQQEPVRRQALGSGGAVDRIGGVLWLLACASLFGTVAVGAEAVEAVPDHAIGFVAGLPLAVVAAVLWRARPGALQSVGLLAGVLATGVGALAVADQSASWTVGVLLAVVGVVWAGLGLGRWLPPRRANAVLGALVAVAGPHGLSLDASIAGLALGVALAVAVVGVGTASGIAAVTGVGVLGLVVYLVRVVADLVPGDLVWVIGMLLAGLLLLAGAVVGLRRARTTSRAS